MGGKSVPVSAEVLAGPYRATIENRLSAERLVLVCEHASNHIPAQWHNLGLGDNVLQAHVAWDPGALALARGLAQRLGTCLVHAPVSRLVYDLNRAPDQEGAMPARSEVFDIPGNSAISAEDRMARTQAVYVPFHDDLHIEIARRLALGLAPVIVTIHSFTPVYNGQPRAVEFGVIHDADPVLAHHIADAAAATGLKTALNEPYSAQDGVTHTLRLQANPYGLPNAMLEIRNDLIANDKMADDMAEKLAPVLRAALAALTERI